MTLRKTLILILIATLICLLSLSLILMFLNPYQSPDYLIFLFYSSLFLSLIGILTLVNLIIKIFFSSNRFVIEEIFHAFRQAFLFSAVIILALVFLRKDILNWLNITVLISVTAVLEVMLVNYHTKK